MAKNRTSPLAPKLCLGCGYILEGLPENRCPECGRGFDPDDPLTFGPRRARSGRRLLWGSLLAYGLVAIPFMLMDCIVVRRGLPSWCGWIEVGLMASGVLLAGYVLQASCRALYTGAATRPGRWAIVAAAAISGFVLGSLAWSILR